MSLQLKLERAGAAQAIKSALSAKKTRHLAALESEMNVVAEHMANNVQYFTPVDEGDLRDAWTPVKKKGRFTWRIENRLDYAVKVNYGQYVRVGPGTRPGGGFMLPGGIDVPSGIYSRKKPEAMLQQALAKTYLEMHEAVRKAAKAVK
jgi:hypothetical protein